METPTLNPPTRWYVSAVILAGLVILVESTVSLIAHPVDLRWLLLAGLTLISGTVSVKLKTISATISVSETFVSTSVLLFGAGAGTLIVALDAFVMSLWMQRGRRTEPFRILFNVAAPALAVWTAGHLFFFLVGVPPLSTYTGEISLRDVAFPLFAFALISFLLNSWLVAFAIALKDSLSAFAVWRDNLLWTSVNYFGGASIAALIVSQRATFDVGLLLIIAPILLVLYFTFRNGLGRVEDANRHLGELNKLYFATIETLAMAIDAKDQVTHGHIRRVQSHAVGLARALGVVSQEQLKAIEAAALLHDMGKLAVPEYILNKPGKLTEVEFSQMKTHAAVGAEILSSIEFPYPVVPIVRHHHENWNGTGYPDGLKGTEIPVGARILSVVDCFDALTSDRPYRRRLSNEQAVQILLERRGSMYDPLVVDTFICEYAGLWDSRSELGPVLQKPGFAAIAGAASSRAAEAIVERESRNALGSDIAIAYKLGRALAPEGMTTKQIAAVVGQQLQGLIRARAYVFYRLSPTRGELEVLHAAGEHAGLLTGLRIPLGHRLSGWVAVNRKTIINSDPALDLGEATCSMHPALANAVSSALAVNDQVVGVVSLYSDGPFTGRDARVLELVAQHAGPMLQSAGQAQHRRLLDPITGLPQVRYLQALLEQELQGSRIRGHIFSVLVVEISGGSHSVIRARPEHSASALVPQVRAALRPDDVLLRSAGDGFVVALVETDHSTALGIGERILESTQSVPQLITAGVRVGAASAPPDGVSLEQLLWVARERLQEGSSAAGRAPSAG
jgi:putative nucleotidyltransferase with HDIG domain